MKLTKYFNYIWLTVAFSIQAFAIDSTDYNHLLRKPGTACAFYFARQSSEFNGRKVSEGLDLKQLKESLKDFDPANERIVAVGAPPDWMSRRKLRDEVEKLMEEAGYPKAKFTTIRKIADFVTSKIGVFAIIPGQEMRRLSGLDEKELESALSGEELREILDAGGSIMISGAPLIGPSRSKLEDGIKAKLAEIAGQDAGVPQVAFDDSVVKMRSKHQAWLRAFVEDPKKTLKDSFHGFMSLFPYREDYVRPTEGEVRSMGQKVTMHTIFTLINFAVQGHVTHVPEPMQVTIPMTLINGLNSAGTGTLRSFIGNWLSRNSDSMGVRTIKGIMMSTFFTLDLYLAKRAFDGHTLASMAHLGGWTNFLAASWVSVLFQAMWRTPVSSVLNHWERWKSETGGPEASVKARNIAGNTEKFLTYIMTQFYLISIVIDSALFKIILNSHHLPQLISGNADVNTAMGQTLLMNFNVGHAAMATVGIGALIFNRHYKLFDKMAPAVEWLDKIETTGYRGTLNFIKKAFGLMRFKKTG